MHFLLETQDSKYTNPEAYQICLLCEDSRLNKLKLHSYEHIDRNEFQTRDDVFSKYAHSVPVGSLEFVRAWLHTFHGVEKMIPIEVPPVLRKSEFLLRDYQILSKGELTRHKRCFFKYAEELKIGFAGTGTFEDIDNLYPLADGLYVQSEPVEVMSEYRVIVLNDRILAVRHYDGNPLVFPDSRAIQKMVLTYMTDTNRPKAYTLDVMVTEKGTAVLEVHPFVSVGTYGYYSSDLPILYYHGLQYYIAQNHRH